jgi:hypothetical protein
MMLLTWRHAEPEIITRWRGPDGGIAAVVAANPPSPVPTIIGPPGVAGPVGPEGPLAELIDCGEFT